MRQALGTAVFFGMIGVTVFGLLFTPIFYVVCRALGDHARVVGGQRVGRAADPAARPNKDQTCMHSTFATLVSALALAACAAGPDYARRSRPAPAAGPFVGG